MTEKVVSKKSVSKKNKSVGSASEKAGYDMPINIHLYTGLLTENKHLRAENAVLKSELESLKAEADKVNSNKSSRAEVLEKLGLRDRIKNLFS